MTNKKKLLACKKDLENNIELLNHYNNLIKNFESFIPNRLFIEYLTKKEIIILIKNNIESSNEFLKNLNQKLKKIPKEKISKVEKEKSIWFNEKKRITDKTNLINNVYFKQLCDIKDIISNNTQTKELLENEVERLKVNISKKHNNTNESKRKIIQNNVNLKKEKKQAVIKKINITKKIEYIRGLIETIELKIQNTTSKKKEYNKLFYQHLDTIKNLEREIEDIQTHIETVIQNQHQNKEDKDNVLLNLFSKKEEKENELQNLKLLPINNINKIYEDIDNKKNKHIDELNLYKQEFDNLNDYIKNTEEEINKKYNIESNVFLEFSDMIKYKKLVKQKEAKIKNIINSIQYNNSLLEKLHNENKENLQQLNVENDRCEQRYSIMMSRLENWDDTEISKTSSEILKCKNRIISFESTLNENNSDLNNVNNNIKNELNSIGKDYDEFKKTTSNIFKINKNIEKLKKKISLYESI